MTAGTIVDESLLLLSVLLRGSSGFFLSCSAKMKPPAAAAEAVNTSLFEAELTLLSWLLLLLSVLKRFSNSDLDEELFLLFLLQKMARKAMATRSMVPRPTSAIMFIVCTAVSLLVSGLVAGSTTGLVSGLASSLDSELASVAAATRVFICSAIASGTRAGLALRY